MRIFDTLPEPEKLRHRADERFGLRAEEHRQLADGVFVAAVQLQLILDRRAVFILQRAFERHRAAVRREKRHKLARGADELLERGENVVDAALRRRIVHIFGEDLIDEIRPARPQPVRERVHLADDLLVEHQTVQCLFQKEPSPLTYFDLLIIV